jgi:hypothetical protein
MKPAMLLLATLTLAGCGTSTRTVAVTSPPAPRPVAFPTNTGQCPRNPYSRAWTHGPCVVLLYRRCTATKVAPLYRAMQRTSCRILHDEGEEAH